MKVINQSINQSVNQYPSIVIDIEGQDCILNLELIKCAMKENKDILFV